MGASFESNMAFISGKEGGLSRAKTDLASSHPAPCTITDPRTGVTASDWHTNRGVTYPTFLQMAPLIGYQATCENFAKMPNDIWAPIYRRGYWDTMLASSINSQVVADFVAWVAWNSGVSGSQGMLRKFLATKGYNASSQTDIVNALNQGVAKEGEKKFFDDLFLYRKNYLHGLNQPANERGWFNALDAFYVERVPGIGSQAAMFTKTHPGTIIAIGLLVTAAVVLLIFRKRLVNTLA